MAVRQRRGRYIVEFQQSGIRVFRVLPPSCTKAQAAELETKLRRDLFDRGPLGHKPEITLPAAIQLWLEGNHRKNQKQALSEAKQWAPFVEGKLLREAPEVAASALRQWQSSARNVEKRANGMPAALPSTINRRLCILKAAAKYAWKQGWIQDNVSGRITLLPERNQREVYLTKAQVTMLARCAETGQLSAAILIASYTGLRASELLALTRMNTTRQGTLTVAATDSKNRKPRVVLVPLRARPYLSALPLGLSYWKLHKQFLAARKKCGLPKEVTFHTLRHTCASWLIREGVDLYTVSKILGHSSIYTTQRYAHLADTTLKKAMARLR